MDFFKNLLKGITFGLGFSLIIGIIFSLVYAAGFHYPSEIFPGAFQTGDYSFNGSLGIGTSTPTQKLDVNGSIKAAGLWDLDSNYFVNPDASGVAAAFNGNVGIGITTPISKLDINGTLFTRSLDGSDIVAMHHTGIVGVVRTTYTTSGSFTLLTFQTSNLERIRVDTNGNIGIGTTTPQEKLEVNGHILGTPIMGNWYPSVAYGPAASAGTSTYYPFDGQFDVTAPEYFTYLGGINGIKIEKAGYYHIKMKDLTYLGGAGDYGHLHLSKNGITIDVHHGHPAATAGWEDRFTDWQGWVNAGDIITAYVYHQIATPYSYHGGPVYTRLTIERLD